MNQCRKSSGVNAFPLKLTFYTGSSFHQHHVGSGRGRGKEAKRERGIGGKGDSESGRSGKGEGVV